MIKVLSELLYCFRRNELSDVTIYIDGRETKYQVGQRVHRIIRWILEHADRITQPTKVQLSVGCAGTDIDVEIKEHEQIGLIRIGK